MGAVQAGQGRGRGAAVAQGGAGVARTVRHPGSLRRRAGEERQGAGSDRRVGACVGGRRRGHRPRGDREEDQGRQGPPAVKVGGRLAIALVTMVLAGCAARAPMRPAGTAAPDPTAADAFVQATKPCAGLNTMTGALHLSGRGGAEKIRGTLHAGLEAPAAVRFEAIAPFGQPFFILAGRDDRASLLLPRENRILTDASVPALLERLTGLSLSASDLRLILTGCLAERTEPSDGRSWPGGWRAVSVGPGVTA